MTADPKMSSSLEVFSLNPLKAGPHETLWQELADTSIDPNPFFTPGFLQAYLRDMSVSPVRLVGVRDKVSSRWLAAAPVGRRRNGLVLPMTGTWATEYAPLGTPLLHDQANEAVLRLFLEAATGQSGTLAIPYLPVTSKTATRFKDAFQNGACWSVRSERAGQIGGADEAVSPTAGLSAKRRKEMRRLLRRLEDHGRVTFDSLVAGQAIAGFEAFLTLEEAGWKGRIGTALNSRPQTAAFARSAIRAKAENGGVRIDQLWAGDTLVAALVLFVEQGQVYSWKIAFDERFAKYSPGAQIAVYAARQNLGLEGFQGADSLAVSGHQMIEPLWRGRVETGTLLIGSGPLTRLRQTALGADLAVNHKLRKIGRSLRKKLQP
ncbi:GNAT family N-acetyltransferase [Roseibium denhamense]|uniref:Acetyltransferase (GNAT) domain-containing protein n=1 Tax=Roseibium denhamense TaxID=76305 RepID=A0ABY1P885_9HYPH|nr:GNAT family N-acetyltransferase [Roseibium denhamense]SMP28777.1 Acetyltransferase (GNAT) domain-containing protein [Roseibium denhamense]